MSLKSSRTLCAAAVLFATSLPAFAVSVTPASSSEPALSTLAGAVVANTDKPASHIESGDQVVFKISILKHEHPKGAVSLEAQASLLTQVGKPVSYFSGNTISYLSSVTSKESDEPCARETAAAADAIDAALNDAFGDKVQGGSAEQVASSSAFETAVQASGLSGVDGAEGADSSGLFGGGPDISMTTDTLQIGDRIALTPLSVNKDGSIEAQVDFQRSTLQSMNNFTAADDVPAIQLPQVFSQGAQQEVHLVPGKAATVHLPTVDLVIRGHVLKGE